MIIRYYYSEVATLIKPAAGPGLKEMELQDAIDQAVCLLEAGLISNFRSLNKNCILLDLYIRC
jgi:hypothetical protein